ncbi:phage head-tail adapter protein [Sphingomonas ginsenosidimutans]|uniref:Phage head-tail adapter protein n=1 Tax=Sphingomonas ginsenosidimutans TaxID=862134 RepID=A0A2A4I142_9SPHN|nr:head-tail adaptor protein [Sphingomonas ginsenosidimutans]PCG09655.1 phage head-tail adapter protein [Sphingomonas ginsenosidimutans]
MIAAGELEWQIGIYRRPAEDDGFSSSPGTPVKVGEVWAKKSDIRDGERLAAAANGQIIEARFLVRYDEVTSALAASDQLDCEGVRYEVVGIREARGRRVGIEITAKAIRP